MYMRRMRRNCLMSWRRVNAFSAPRPWKLRRNNVVLVNMLDLSTCFFKNIFHSSKCVCNFSTFSERVNMYTPQFGYTPNSNPVLGSSSYCGVGSIYDNYDSIPFPFVSCSVDPKYEMLWCASQNVRYFCSWWSIGIPERIFDFKSPIAVLCRSNSEPRHLQHAVHSIVVQLGYSLWIVAK